MSAIAWKSAAGTFFLYVLVSLIVCLTAAAQSASPPLASADAAMQEGRFADAARQYEAWLKAHPDSKEVLLALGICYVQLERQNEAVATLGRYVKLVPASAAGHAALGIALLDGAKTAEAKAELETAVRLNPKQVDAVEALARVYLSEGNADEAVSLLRPLVASGANDEDAELCRRRAHQGRAGEAAGAMFERELQSRSPHNVSDLRHDGLGAPQGGRYGQGCRNL